MTDTLEPHGIGRREALERTALLIGGVLAASTLRGGAAAAWADTPGWRPRTLTPAQLELVATLAEHIIPTTDTPGARAAGVHRLVDVLLTDFYEKEERDRFLAGIAATNARAIAQCGAPFLRCSPREQLALVTAMDVEAYPSKSAVANAEPQMSELQRMRDSLSRPGSTAPATTPTASAAPEDGRTGRALAAGWFFRRMKELTLLGYYTSEVGSTKELRVTPFGPFLGDIPYARVGRGWA